MRFLRPPTGLPARGKVTYKLCAAAQIWTGRYEGIDEWLQREGSRRLGEGALGGTPQEKLRNRYETCDRQGQQIFSFTASVATYSDIFARNN
jgi:hypothetical protein